MSKSIRLRLSSYCIGILSLFIYNNAFSYNAADLKGFWAMKPLDNGMANVGYFDGKTKSILYSFTCDFNQQAVISEEEPEEAHYEVKDDVIYLSYPDLDDMFSRELKFEKISDTQLLMEERHPNFVSTYEYVKMNEAKSLCFTQ